MNNQDPKSRVQRYNFNADDQHLPRRRRRQRRWWPWIMTLLTLTIAVVLVLVINTHKSSSSSDTATASSAESSLATNSSSTSKQSAYDQFEAKYRKYLTNGTLTAAQQQKLQAIVNAESNSATQAREQKLLDQAKVPKASETSSSATEQSSAAKSSSNPTSFGTTHTFSSVNDAQNWAQASKNQWLQAGYSTYTITSDGQGNYNLQFVR
ncbi:hypothetical protein [Levilactobacillus acidifarinae]|uniref:hypothetical protein n=1 Tax=Levilactobacillus acidifarinae TaxID=267364 RepID=UPI00070F0805|nr:hypothetical protein [Levilactobacillus acidifarinae]